MNKAKAENRVGCFRASMSDMEKWVDDDIAAVFGAMIIVRAEHDLSSGLMNYAAYSMIFEPVERYREPPWYKLSFDLDDREKPQLAAEKMNKRSFW